MSNVLTEETKARVRELRRVRGLKLEEIADVLGISRASVIKILAKR